ncbi:hypothetical protein H6F96_21425 [Microcoleus sp. FACHB-53]|jgi:hypothetical protein|nr:hypothetical protein [Microcoleus sp. FACHB-53]MBD2126779.1 hypothetical protein [Microcoleus sp. FACHB-1]
MASTSNIQVAIAPKGSDLDVTIDLRNSQPDLAPEELETLTQRLFQQMKDIDEVKQVHRIPEPNPPAGSKPLDAAFLIGLLQAEVNLANIKALLGFIWERLSGKPIELTVEANGKKLEVKAYSEQELTAAIEAAKDFLAAGS